MADSTKLSHHAGSTRGCWNVGQLFRSYRAAKKAGEAWRSATLFRTNGLTILGTLVPIVVADSLSTLFADRGRITVSSMDGNELGNYQSMLS
jgi:hypothetical protein